MSNGQDTSPEQTEEQGEPMERAKKELPPRWININVKMVDGHYLVTFRHDEVRVFHNMEELLRAIEVECEKLK